MRSPVSSNYYLINNNSNNLSHQQDLSLGESGNNHLTARLLTSNMANSPSPPHLHSTNGDGQHEQYGAHKLGRVKSLDTCRVCGDGPARPHYGVPTCFGCKGFFRRTLKRTKEYTCRYNGNCVVDRYERNSCRFCRFKRCLEVGMDPKAVRPDRDAAGRTHAIRHRRSRNSLGELAVLDEESSNASDDWIRKLPVDMRTLLMQVMNIELLVANSDSSNENAKKVYPLPYDSLRQILEDPTLLDGKRTDMRYEPYRQIQPDELIVIAHRRLVAVIDMVDHLCALMDLHNIEDKIALIKAAYAPLALFCSVAATAKITKNRDILCLCSFGYVPRGAHNSFDEGPSGLGAYHFANRLVDRALDELVEPFRAFNFKEQEVGLMKAIVTLNPHIRSMSTEAAEQVADLRDRIQETLYNVVRESHPKEVASSRFGNLLLFLPNTMMLGNVMYENLQFIQSFGKQHIDPLLGELLDNIEPMTDLNGVTLDDVLSLSDQSESNFMRHSQSASSIPSMTSPDSCSSSLDSNHSQASSTSYLDSYYSGRRASMSKLCVANEGNASGMEQNQQTHKTSGDSDPDYNITLTADTFSEMRQVMAQSMDVDLDNHSASQDYLNPPPAQKPRFFIESNGSGTPLNTQCSTSNNTCMPASHTTIGSRHVFTVESTNLDTIYKLQQQQRNHQRHYAGFDVQQTNGSSSSSLEQNPCTIPMISMAKSQSYPFNMMDASQIQHPQFSVSSNHPYGLQQAQDAQMVQDNTYYLCYEQGNEGHK